MTSASTFSDERSDGEVEGVTVGERYADVDLLQQRPFPTLDDHYFLHGRIPQENETVTIMQPAALQQVHAHSISNMRSELGGVLLGYAYRDGDQLFVSVEAALAAVSSDHGPIHFTFSADSWTQIHRDKDAHFPELEIVGWFHTHPNLGVFYSSDDVVVHSAAFALPWHVGLVVDPVRKEASFFGWVDDKLAPLSGYYEPLTEPSLQPIARWRAVPTSVWHLMEVDSNPNPDSASGLTPLQSRPQTAVSPSEWGMLAAVFGGLLFFLAVGWAVLLNQEVTQLEQVVITLADNPANNWAATCPDSRLRMLVPEQAATFAVGDRIQFMGTADVPGATRYQLQARAAGSNAQWMLLNTRRTKQTLGALMSWNTKDAVAGAYDVRITAVDRTNLQLPNAPTCQLQINLTP